VPLVGFDADGNRLGMGAGFYDRHFAFLRHRRAWHRPLLIGLAFERQRVARLPAAAHDVPLWGVVTERGFYRGTRR
jgi:5-formyltetrahydrofolate cyclo-ligase